MDTKQPEAQRIATESLPMLKIVASLWDETGLISLHGSHLVNLIEGYDAARLEIASLQAQLEAAGAGGVSALMGVSQAQPVSAPPTLPPIPAGWDGSWKWMRHPDWNNGEPMPVQTWLDDGTVYYRPFDCDATEFDWAERDAEWEEAPLPPQPAAQALDAREKLHIDVACAIWEVMREYEDRCDMELEDVGCSHVVWQLANAAIAAQQGGRK